jgi:uncharacterized protein DUF6573
MDDDKESDATDPKLISSYMRSEALDDGVLVDVTDMAREAGFVIPVALTRAAWDLCVALSPAAERAGNDERGRLWDVLSMLRWAISRSRSSGGSEVRFDVLCVTESVRPSRITLRSVVGPGDDGQPVLTVMLPDES